MGIRRNTLGQWRRAGKGPPWMQLGPREFVYPADEFREWLRTQIDGCPECFLATRFSHIANAIYERAQQQGKSVTEMRDEILSRYHGTRHRGL